MLRVACCVKRQGAVGGDLSGGSTFVFTLDLHRELNLLVCIKLLKFAKRIKSKMMIEIKTEANLAATSSGPVAPGAGNYLTQHATRKAEHARMRPAFSDLRGGWLAASPSLRGSRGGRFCRLHVGGLLRQIEVTSTIFAQLNVLPVLEGQDHAQRHVHVTAHADLVTHRRQPLLAPHPQTVVMPEHLRR